jgi:hypothetical protein
MTAGPPADGLSLSRWWDRVSPLRPRAWWVGTLDLIHLDATVRVLRPEPIDPLHRLLLRAIEAAGPADLDRLNARLGLGRAALFRWLDQLRALGVVRTNDPYALTSTGADALSVGMVARPAAERRRFTFLINPDGSAHFLPWKGPTGDFVPALAAAADVRWLAECIARPASWKRRAQFPEDVADMEASANEPGAAAWRRLAIAHGEQSKIAIVLTTDTPPHLVAFTVQQGDPDPGAPALRLDAGWEEIFPELDSEPVGTQMDVGDWVLRGGGRLRRAECVK